MTWAWKSLVVNKLIRAAYKLLDLNTYFTAGEKRGTRLDDQARHGPHHKRLA